MVTPAILWQLMDLRVQDLSANVLVSDELKSTRQILFTTPGWIDQELTLGEVYQIAIYGCLETTYHPMKNYKILRQLIVEYGDQIVDYLVSKITHGKMSEIWTYQPHDFSGKMYHLFALSVEVWATDLVFLLAESGCTILN